MVTSRGHNILLFAELKYVFWEDYFARSFLFSKRNSQFNRGFINKPFKNITTDVKELGSRLLWSKLSVSNFYRLTKTPLG